MSQGRFITFEGGEGCGKSTQARLLAEWLRAQGVDVFLTREPGGTVGAEAIRELLLHPPGAGWSSRAEALLFAAARADHVEKLIEPALKEGRWVVCDRFVDSSLAYQGVAGGLGLQAIRQLHRIGSSGLLPDRTILLELVPATAAVRLTLRDKGMADAIGGRDEAYHQGVADAFAALKLEEPERLVGIDGGGDVTTVHQRVRAAVEPMLRTTSEA